MKDSKPRILIAAPAWIEGWWGGGKVLAPPLALPLLAAMTPDDFDVQLIDENVEPVDLKADVDLVAISCMTASAPRAYAIADAFRKREIPIVMGGIHPTVMPKEAGLHANAVVIGEAELVWKEILADFDFGRGRLKQRYQADQYCDMKDMPLPRRDLLKCDRYQTVNLVQTARGCPHACTFCSVSTVAGRQYRFRPVPEVIKEVQKLKGWVGFVDDNITGKASRAKELFEALIPLKKRWVGQADLNMANDPELLRLAARSGCQAMFIGLESVSEENLRDTHKAPNVGTDMAEAIVTIHKAGIEIIGSFVLGLDQDFPDVFVKTARFAEEQKLAAAQFSVLTPFPGTAIREKFEQEGRILEDYGWDRYTMSDVVFSPKNMTPEELHQGKQWVYRKFYSLPSIIRRSFTWRGRILLKLFVNWSYSRIGRKKGLSWWLPGS